MRVLFSFGGGLGHANPMVPVARACLDAGHAVAFSGRASATEVLSAAGFDVFTDSTDTAPAAGELVAIDMEHEYAVLREHFAGRLARERVSIVSDVVEAWRADVVVCDEVDFGGTVAAELRGLPSATVLSLAPSFVRNAGVEDSVERLRSEFGLGSRAMTRERHLVLSPFPRTFRPVSGPGGIAFRHTVAEPVVRAPGVTPSVYFTLGTEFNDESGDLFERVLEGLRSADVTAVVTVGREVDPARFGPQSASIRIERFVPQEEVLRSCDVVINHGGSGSTLGALTFGRPMVVIPLGADQLLNAERSKELGVAIVLDALRLTSEDVRDAVWSLSRERSYRLHAGRLRDEIAALPPPGAAVVALEAIQEHSAWS